MTVMPSNCYNRSVWARKGWAQKRMVIARWTGFSCCPEVTWQVFSLGEPQKRLESDKQGAKHYSSNNYRRNGKHHALFPHSNPRPTAPFHPVSEEPFKAGRPEENSNFIATLKPSDDTAEPISLRHLIRLLCLSMFLKYTCIRRRDRSCAGFLRCSHLRSVQPFSWKSPINTHSW